jgi:DNA polymerase III delta prime subunit
MTLSEQFGNPETKLHHFYVIEGSDDHSLSDLSNVLKTRSGNVRTFSYSTLGVEEAQSLRQEQNELSHDGEDQYFILSAVSVTHEAQQTLLKMFEEPRANTHFFLLMAESTAILPTVRSRAQMVRLENEVHAYAKETQSFIKSGIADRVSFVAEFVKSHEDDDSSGELRLHASQFIIALIEALRKDPKNLVTRKDFFKDALSMREHLDNRGASVKMILEHLAITL